MITGFHHIVLFCTDSDASRRWYESAGFDYMRGYDGMHWFALGDGEIMLHPGGQPVADAAQAVHVSVTELDDVFRRVMDAGLQPFDHQQPGVKLGSPVTRPWGDREFELLDPDGHRWAFTEATAG